MFIKCVTGGIILPLFLWDLALVDFSSCLMKRIFAITCEFFVCFCEVPEFLVKLKFIYIYARVIKSNGNL
jgi:hypothetical protein